MFCSIEFFRRAGRRCVYHVFFYFYSHKNVCSILSLALLIHRQHFWWKFEWNYMSSVILFWSETVLWARVLFFGLFSTWRLVESVFIGVAS